MEEIHTDAIVPIIIPSYEPDGRLCELAGTLKDYPYGPVILVNDGSDSSYDHFFKETMERLGAKGIYLQHDQNRGKGAALKTAFLYVLKHMPAASGVTTADSDGQHRASDIRRVSEALLASPGKLILGTRDFTGKDIPWKSRFGNNLTSFAFSMIAGKKISDTQTGLRGIPLAFLEDYLQIPGDRFEFETEMLLRTDQAALQELKIETIYDSTEHHTTHFHPIRDSFRIYRLLLGKPIKFLLSSLSSAALDIGLFALFTYCYKDLFPTLYIAAAAFSARIISIAWNYLINRRVVFESKKKNHITMIKYLVLAVIQINVSAFLTTAGALAFPFMPPVIIKMIVDVMLFFISYRIQNHFIF